MEKIVTRRLQFDAIKYGILHPNQLEGVAQQSTEDASVFLTHLVQAGWAKGLKTSIIAFDITQFFPSLNHSMLTSILSHFGFANCIVDFFSNYLVGRSTQNSFFSRAYDTNVCMGQDFVLSPILSVLYIALLIRIFEHRAQALNLDTCILSFVDDGLLISQGKTYNKTLPELYNSYRVVTDLMVTFGLVIENLLLF